VNGNDGRDNCVKVEARRGFALPERDPVVTEALNDLMLLVRPFFTGMIGQEMDHGHAVGVRGHAYCRGQLSWPQKLAVPCLTLHTSQQISSVSVGCSKALLELRAK